MTVNSKDITIQPQEGSWLLFVLCPLLAAAFSAEMLRLEVWPVWWVPAVVLLLAAPCLSALIKPVEIAFRTGSRTFELTYRLGGLIKNGRTVPFDELKSIRSYIDSAGEDAYIRLVLRLKTGERIELKHEHPDWDSSATLFGGLTGCREPQAMAALRRRVASLTGIEDLGFQFDLKADL
jgi:hypothetical protein